MSSTSPQPRQSDLMIPGLSNRQLQCLNLAASGLPSAVIGGQLGISPRTVDEHLAAACEVLGVRTRIQAVAYLAFRERSQTQSPPITWPRLPKPKRVSD